MGFADDKKRMVRFGFPFVKKLNDATRAVAKHQRALLVDIEGRLNQDPSFFLDPVHLTSKGNFFIAQEVAVALGKTGLLKGPTKPRGIRPIECD